MPSRRKERFESQVLELKRQIAATGDVLVREYVDNGYSGSLLDRLGLGALRRDVRTPLFDAVYFLDTDRIARDVAYQTIILGELLKYGKQIIIKGRDYVNNPTVLGAVAELERAKIIERTTRGRIGRLCSPRTVTAATSCLRAIRLALVGGKHPGRPARVRYY